MWHGEAVSENDKISFIQSDPEQTPSIMRPLPRLEPPPLSALLQSPESQSYGEEILQDKQMNQSNLARDVSNEKASLMTRLTAISMQGHDGKRNSLAQDGSSPSKGKGKLQSARARTKAMQMPANADTRLNIPDFLENNLCQKETLHWDKIAFDEGSDLTSLDEHQVWDLEPTSTMFGKRCYCHAYSAS